MANTAKPELGVAQPQLLSAGSYISLDPLHFSSEQDTINRSDQKKSLTSKTLQIFHT